MGTREWFSNFRDSPHFSVVTSPDCWAVALFRLIRVGCVQLVSSSEILCCLSSSWFHCQIACLDLRRLESIDLRLSLSTTHLRLAQDQHPLFHLSSASSLIFQQCKLYLPSSGWVIPENVLEEYIPKWGKVLYIYAYILMQAQWSIIQA